MVEIVSSKQIINLELLFVGYRCHLKKQPVKLASEINRTLPDM